MKTNYICIFINTYNELKQKYSCGSKADKTRISRNIVSEIKSLDPPGRFIEYEVSSAKWLNVNDKRAWEKTCQALRERKLPKSPCKRDESKKGDITKNSSANSDQFNTLKITTTYINSLSPPLSEQLEHSTLEMVESTYDPPAQCLTHKVGIGVSNNANILREAENNGFMKSMQPNMCIGIPTLPPFLESQTFIKHEDSKFHRALQKIRRKHKTKPTVELNEPAANLSEALQTARDETSSTIHILDQCAAANTSS